MLILGAISISEFGAFFINSRGISSDLGRGILGEPSRDFALPEELSLERLSFLVMLLDGTELASFLKLDSLCGLSPKFRN